MTPFVVLSMARSGTQMFSSLLRCHPSVGHYGEVLHGRATTYPDSELVSLLTDPVPGWMLPPAPANPSVVGFKLLAHQVAGRPLTVSRVLQVPGIRVVVLERKDQIARLRSDAQARVTGRWDCATAPGPLPDVALDPAWTSWWCDVARAWHTQLAEVADCWVTYEGLCRDPQGELDRVFACLGVGSVPVAPGTVRQEPRPTTVTVTNWHDLVFDPTHSSERDPT